jgi:DNA-binding NarL/FixJ family response regulator
MLMLNLLRNRFEIILESKESKMGYFSNLATEVESALFDGAAVAEIALRFNLSEEQVRAYIEQLEDADQDPYDWD